MNMPETPKKTDKQASEARKAYNIVTDTMTGVNIRGSDNVLQMIAAGVGAGVGLLVGVGLLMLLSDDFLLQNLLMSGAIGAIGGAFVCVLATGAYLAIYRLVRHLTGRHD